MNHVLTALWLTLPLVVSGAAHMVLVTRDLLSRLRRPIAERLFGANKTWRGFVFVPLANAATTWVFARLEPTGAGFTVSLRAGSPVLLGFVVGLAYVLAELPNSWMKRRLGIAPGALPTRGAALFALIDQVDSALGCALAYAIMRDVPLVTFALLVVMGPAIKLAVVYGLYLAGQRKRPI